MLKFLDGPAKDQTIACRRAPFLLRVVQSRKGEWDALDQPNDTPNGDEAVFVYRMKQWLGNMHINTGHKPGGGWYADAEYVLMKPQPDESQRRDNKKWAEWCDYIYQQLPPSLQQKIRAGKPGDSFELPGE